MQTKDDKLAVERYLTYLDKEMTIMGILSGFCIAVLAVFLKILTDKDAAIAKSLIACSPVSLLIAHVMLLLAALSFYQERSHLAWYYGQIALEDSGYSTGCDLRGWLQNADGWDTWIFYQRAFWFLSASLCELALAGICVWIHSKPLSTPNLLTCYLDESGGSAIALLVLIAIVTQKRILEKWPQVEDPYQLFLEAPFAIFRGKTAPESSQS